MARIMDGSEYEAGWPQRFNRDGVYHSDMSLNRRIYIWCIVFGMSSARRLSHVTGEQGPGINYTRRKGTHNTGVNDAQHWGVLDEV